MNEHINSPLNAETNLSNQIETKIRTKETKIMNLHTHRNSEIFIIKTS